MTQEDVARKLSARLGEQVPRNYISAMETQWKMWPSIERLTALADVYEMSQAERLLLMREFGAGDLVYKGVDVELDRDLEELFDLFGRASAHDRQRILRMVRAYFEED